MPDLLIALLSITALLILLEVIARLSKCPPSVMRKITHVSTSLLICLIALLMGHTIFVYLGLLFIFVLAGVRHIYPLRSLSDRASQSYGEVFFAVGIMSAAFICTTAPQFITTVLILGLADTTAYFIGRHFTSPKILFGKTILGSLAFVITSFVICLFTLSPLHALGIALVLSACELVSPYGSDNATVSIAAAALLVVAA